MRLLTFATVSCKLKASERAVTFDLYALPLLRKSYDKLARHTDE
ncbi:hypothetical protein [uncultured Porphyromonas sp.]|nr:hypothetical protein [uncultured Porphyromonas sp.]